MNISLCVSQVFFSTGQSTAIVVVNTMFCGLPCWDGVCRRKMTVTCTYAGQIKHIFQVAYANLSHYTQPGTPDATRGHRGFEKTQTQGVAPGEGLGARRKKK